MITCGEFDEWIEESIKINESIKNPFEPEYGAIVYTDLIFGLGDHSGIYIGDKTIIAVHSDGLIEKASLEKFTGGFTTLVGDIYVPFTLAGESIGHKESGDRAISMIGNRLAYNLLLNNCHQFCAGCLDGEFFNDNNFLWMLKDTARKHYGGTVFWRRWEWRS